MGKHSSALMCKFKEAEAKSQSTHLFECQDCCRVFWVDMSGDRDYDTQCPDCNGDAFGYGGPSIGIGWFKCECGRIFAGFCKSDVPSKCHGCQREVLAAFVTEGDRADKKDGAKKKQHHCNVCRGDGTCPVVEEALKSRRAC